jgi:ADP-ribosylglycohydrolase
MDQGLLTRCESMVLGAVTADAAAMGLHWIYDQPRIRAIAPEAPKFHTADSANYEGVPAYFAHPTRAVGDTSQYGEQAMVMLRTLGAAQGRYDAADFAEAFRSHFGYGGAYVGYIDHATRQTLDNHVRHADAALACAHSFDYEGDSSLPRRLVGIALPLLARHQGAELHRQYTSALEAQNLDAPALAFATDLLDALRNLPQPTGASDIQLPAIAKLPPLVAVLAAQGIAAGPEFDAAVASAIRVTSDHPEAAAYGLICARMMSAALVHGTAEAVTAAAHEAAEDAPAAVLAQVRSMRERPNTDVARHFGMACDLSSGVPVALHCIATADSFVQAARMNIYAGGDTCGRAMLIGAVTGAVFGEGGQHRIPHHWSDRLTGQHEVRRLLDALIR